MPPRLPAATSSSRVESSYSRGLLHHQRSLRGHQQHRGASALQEADFAKACCCCKRKSFFCACFSLNEIKDSGVHRVDTQRHARANFGKLLAFSPSVFSISTSSAVASRPPKVFANDIQVMQQYWQRLTC